MACGSSGFIVFGNQQGRKEELFRPGCFRSLQPIIRIEIKFLAHPPGPPAGIGRDTDFCDLFSLLVGQHNHRARN
jgi:hypothetical protein